MYIVTAIQLGAESGWPFPINISIRYIKTLSLINLPNIYFKKIFIRKKPMEVLLRSKQRYFLIYRSKNKNYTLLIRKNFIIKPALKFIRHEKVFLLFLDELNFGTPI